MIRALGWDHARCRLPMVAASEVWSGPPVEWRWRSLEEFGDQPAHAVAADCDLLVIDHPSIGEAVEAHAIVPIDRLVSSSAIAAIRADALGPNVAAYERDGRLWALPLDAASQVAGWRPEDVAAPPASWDEVVELARDGGVCLALHPAQAICALGSLCAMRGGPLGAPGHGDVWRQAYEDLRAVAELGPSEQYGWQQPDVLSRIARGVHRYTPLVFGFSSYAGGEVRFGPPPAPDGHLSRGTLGGAGIALTATASPEAAAFAAWLAGRDVQRGIILRSGGQPASRSAWDAAAADGGGGFYAALRESIECAWVRPTDAWWPDFQRRGGALLVASLRDGDDAGSAVRRLRALMPTRCR